VSAIVTDTHALLWYLLQPAKLSTAASAAFDKAAADGEPVYLSAISVVEIAYLVEKGRFLESDWNYIASLFGSPIHRIVVTPLDATVAIALRRIPRPVVPEMGDRIIAATALALDLPLVTRDPKIRAASITTIW
jgi:PIN domain nuclease of toxin-antitoxin system